MSPAVEGRVLATEPPEESFGCGFLDSITMLEPGHHPCTLRGGSPSCLQGQHQGTSLRGDKGRQDPGNVINTLKFHILERMGHLRVENLKLSQRLDPLEQGRDS